MGGNDSTWRLETPPGAAVTEFRAPKFHNIAPRELVREALEAPFHFEPLRRALTPDDHVAVVLDADLPHAAELLAGVFEHLLSAGIDLAAVTAIVPPGSQQDWIDRLPEEFEAVTVETHDPANRKKLAYLASTQAGRRVYLNRTLIEADFSIVLTGRRFDSVYGCTGAELALYPALADEEIRAANAGPFTKQEPWNGREESREVAWLLGTPFFVNVIEGGSGGIHEVVAGLLESSDESRNRLESAWTYSLDAKVDLAIAAFYSAAPAHLTFQDLAQAAATAARAVKKGGRIALLADGAAPELGEAAEWIRALDEPKAPLSRIAREKPADWAACKLWCSAAGHASLFLTSRYPDDLVEELFAAPLHTAAELQRLIDAAGSIAVMKDAQRIKIVTA